MHNEVTHHEKIIDTKECHNETVRWCLDYGLASGWLIIPTLIRFSSLQGIIHNITRSLHEEQSPHKYFRFKNKKTRTCAGR